MDSKNDLKPNKNKFRLEDLKKDTRFDSSKNQSTSYKSTKDNSSINDNKLNEQDIKNHYTYEETKEKDNSKTKKYIIAGGIAATILFAFSFGLSFNTINEKKENYYSKNNPSKENSTTNNDTTSANSTSNKNSNSNANSNTNSNKNSNNDLSENLIEKEPYEEPEVYNSSGANKTDEVYNSTNTKTKNNFLFNSSKEKLTYFDLEDLTVDELEIAKSEIAARYGCIFINDKPNLQKYFNEQKWYKPNPNYSFDQLSELEKSNYIIARATLFAKKSYAKNNRIQGDFVFPNSNVEEISEYDVSRLTDWEVQIAKNEIFARYGLRFSLKNLANHFKSKSWYTPIPGLTNDMKLNPVETKNIDILLKEEKIRMNLCDTDISK